MLEKVPRELGPREEIRIPIGEGRTLFISGRPGVGYQIWLDGSFDYSGIGLGAAATRDEARAAALDLLLTAVRSLRGACGKVARAVDQGASYPQAPVENSKPNREIIPG